MRKARYRFSNEGLVAALQPYLPADARITGVVLDPETEQIALTVHTEQAGFPVTGGRAIPWVEPEVLPESRTLRLPPSARSPEDRRAYGQALRALAEGLEAVHPLIETTPDFVDSGWVRVQESGPCP